ncbi:MAG: DUF58 domain-containing protein [Coprococcus sp.]|nr:DUF58 domain-containing protein [Coprococcus sp.]
MLGRSIGYLLAVLLGLYLFFMYDGYIWTGLLIVEALYPFVSAAFLWHMKKKVTVRFGRFPAMAEQSKQFTGTLMLRNHSRIWTVRYRVFTQVKNHFSRSGAFPGVFPKAVPMRQRFSGFLAPSKGQMEHIVLDSQYAGMLEYQLESLILYDMLGLFCWRIRLQDRRSIGVMPTFKLMPLEITRRTREFMAEADEYSTERKGDDPSEIYQVRKYSPPDSLRLIHWKLSAKEDELMVKENGFPQGCVVLLWIRLPYAYTDSASFHRLLEQAASLSITLLEEKCIHMAAWFEEKSGRVIKWRVDAAEAVYEWIWRLLFAVPFRDKELERTCFEDAFRGVNFSSVVMMGTDGSLTVNGEVQELLQL